MHFYNLAYGFCTILESNDEWYLVETEKKSYDKYIVCKTIMEDGALLNQNFFEKYEDALEFYYNNSKQKLRVIK